MITTFGAISMVCAIEMWAERRGSSPSRMRARAIGFAAIAVAGVLWLAVAADDRPRAPEFRVRKLAEQESPWVDICRWIESQGPRGNYIAPPGSEGFTYLSDRSTVVAFKINPDGGTRLREWFDRLRDLAGGSLPDGKGFENAVRLNRSYRELRVEHLAALAETYDAGFAVLPAGAAAGLPVLYRNAGYQLTDLRGLDTWR
jgi:hypothetical protein